MLIFEANNSMFSIMDCHYKAVETNGLSPCFTSSAKTWIFLKMCHSSDTEHTELFVGLVGWLVWLVWLVGWLFVCLFGWLVGLFTYIDCLLATSWTAWTLPFGNNSCYLFQPWRWHHLYPRYMQQHRYIWTIYYKSSTWFKAVSLRLSARSQPERRRNLI